MSLNVTHWSAADHDVGKSAGLEMLYAYNQTMVRITIKLILEFGGNNTKLQFECENIEMSPPILDSTTIGAKIADAKTPAQKSTHVGAIMSDAKISATDSSALEGKSRK